MTTRRKFFEVLGFSAGGATGAMLAPSLLNRKDETPVNPTIADDKTIKQIEAAGYNGKLALGATYGEPMPPNPNHHQYAIIGTNTFAPGTRKDVQVSMTVGPDGNLYLKQNGKWARIVTA